jgi:hypothetical protein
MRTPKLIIMRRVLGVIATLVCAALYINCDRVLDAIFPGQKR